MPGIAHPLAAIAFILVPSASSLAQETYILDTLHTATTFHAAQFSVSMPRGSFPKTTGKVTLDRTAKKGSIDVAIDAASVVSRTPQQAELLKSAEYFDAARFPAITYKSNQLIFAGETLVGAEGELTLRGVTRPVALNVANFRCIPVHPLTRKPACGAEATATIKRSEFAMAPRGADADDVVITVVVEGLQE